MIIKNNANVYYNNISKPTQKGELQMLTFLFIVAILKDLYCILMASCPRRYHLQAILKQSVCWRRTFTLFITGTGVLSNLPPEYLGVMV